MANGTETQIDKLGIDISVRENDAAAKINAVAKAINQLRKSLVSLTDVSKQMNKITKMFSSLNIPKSAGGTKIKTPKDILRKIEVPEKSRTAMLKNTEIPDLNPADTEKAQDAFKGVVTNYSQWLDMQEKGNKQNKDAAKSTNKFALSFKTLLKSVGRIAFYRAIRTAIKEIVQAAKEGIANIRSVDKDLDNSLNRLSKSATTLKNSFAMLLVPVIKAIEPVITSLADSIANIVNKFTEAQAVLKGQDKYTKILTSDTEEYQKALKKTQGSLLSFDTFTLNKANDYTGVKEEEVTMPVENAKEYQKKLAEISQTFKDLVQIVSDLVVIIKELAVVAWSTWGQTFISQIKGVLEFVKELFNMFKAIGQVLSGDVSNGIEAVAKSFLNLIGIIAKLVISFNPIALLIKGLGKLFGFDTSFIDNAANAVRDFIGKPLGYASGGNYQAGDYFVANENGNTELVASSNTGGGSVMNLDQWASISYSSFYRALSDYDAAQNGRGGELDLNSLGRTIAGNTGFVNEMNRRNSTLNLI